MTIYLKLNGELTELPTGLTISKLLESKKIKPDLVTVELNDRIIPREEYDRLILSDGDILEFLYYMGGGS